VFDKVSEALLSLLHDANATTESNATTQILTLFISRKSFQSANIQKSWQKQSHIPSLGIIIALQGNDKKNHLLL
jgi:hypothetical protein